MRNPFISKEEQLDLELKEAEYKVIQLKKRKARTDVGKKRTTYDSNLPANYKRYLYSANKRGISFNLSLDEFNIIIKHACVYCGSRDKIGIDRKDSSLGYDTDNCQPACGACNLMKYTHSEETFLRKIQAIYNHRLATGIR